MSKFDYENAFSRNIGIYSRDEQNLLFNCKVAIIGSGGDGGLLAERLIRSGIGEIRICDPEEFSIENLNRQFGSNIGTIGFSKSKVVGETLRKINPSANIVVWEEGVNSSNIETFIKGVDLIIDESEYSYPDLAIMINRVARKLSIPILTGANVALGANVFAFSPDGMSVEDYYKMPNVSLDEARDKTIPISTFCPIVPDYVDFAVFRKVANGDIAIPAVSQSVSAVAAVVVNEAIEYLLGRRELVYVPRYISIDLHGRSMKVRRASSWAFSYSLFKVIIKSFLRRD